MSGDSNKGDDEGGGFKEGKPCGCSLINKGFHLHVVPLFQRIGQL